MSAQQFSKSEFKLSYTHLREGLRHSPVTVPLAETITCSEANRRLYAAHWAAIYAVDVAVNRQIMERLHSFKLGKLKDDYTPVPFID